MKLFSLVLAFVACIFTADSSTAYSLSLVRRGVLHPPASGNHVRLHRGTNPARRNPPVDVSRLREISPYARAGGCKTPLRTSSCQGTIYPAKAAPASYTLSGSVQGYRLAGVEPDGDPLYQIVLKTRLAPSTGEPVNIIISSYMENFQPDTTPVLPDLLHPKKTATNLGGFLDGKTLLTDDAGNVLSIGVFLTEAFLDNSNHTVMSLLRSRTDKGTSASLKGTFKLNKNGTLQGRLDGSLILSAAARAQIARNRGAKMKNLKSIINQVTVKPHYYGTPGNGAHASAPLHTGFGPAGGSQSAPAAPSGTQTSRHLSLLTILAGIGAVISLLLAGLLFWVDKRRARPTPAS